MFFQKTTGALGEWGANQEQKQAGGQEGGAAMQVEFKGCGMVQRQGTGLWVEWTRALKRNQESQEPSHPGHAQGEW